MRRGAVVLAACMTALAAGLVAPQARADTPTPAPATPAPTAPAPTAPAATTAAPTPAATTDAPTASPTPSLPAYSPNVAVSITSVSPEVLTANDPVTVTGTLLNKTDRTLTGLTVRLETTGQQYLRRDQLKAARLAPQTVVLQPLPGSFGDPVTTDPDTLAPAARAPFTLSVPHGSDLGVLALFVYPLAVVASTPDGGEQGRDLVDEPYFPGKPTTQIGVSTVIPFTEQPDWTAASPGGTKLAGDLAPGGRLSALLGAVYGYYYGAATAQQPAVTLAVDPALLEQVNALGADTAVPADLRSAALTWSQQLKYLAGLAAVTVSALPYGDADLASLGSSGLSGARGDGVRLLQDSAGEVTAQLGGGLANGVSIDPVFTQDLRMAPATVNVAAAANAGLAIVSAAQLPATAPTSNPNNLIPPTETDVAQGKPLNGALVGTPNSTNPDAPHLPALVTDDVVQTLLRTPADPAYAQRASAEVLAELAMITSEAPSAAPENGGRRGVVMVAPRDWAPPPAEVGFLLQGLGAAQWMTTITPQQNLETRAPITAFPDRTPATDLTQPACQAPDSIPTVQALRPDVAALGDLVTPPTTAISAPLGDTLDRSLSFFWRVSTSDTGVDCSAAPDAPGVALNKLIQGTLPETQATALQSIVYDTFHSTIGKIGVLVAPDRTLTGPSGPLPVDLSNQLGQKVRLRLTLVADDSSAQGTIAGVPLYVTLAADTPNLKQQFELQVTSRRLGTHSARVVVSTGSGKYLFTAKSVAIRSTSYGAVSIGITATALCVLLLAFLVRGFRWLRRRRTS